MPERLFPNKTTNAKRAKGGSVGGLAGRGYPGLVAKRLRTDLEFRARICRCVGRNPDDFVRAEVNLQKKAESVIAGARKADSKTSLRIMWRDGKHTNFSVKAAHPVQALLKRVPNFIPEFAAQYHKRIPRKVKEALQLFVGDHPRQQEILESIPVGCVGSKTRELEQSYRHRLTLASMAGYDDQMPKRLMGWFAANMADLLDYCFVRGAVRDPKVMPDYLWLHVGTKANSDFEIVDLKALVRKVRRIPRKSISGMIHPGDRARIGSTIDLPFGVLQYHEKSLQFRHDRGKLRALVDFAPARKSTFGSKPKEDGHRNELLIAETLNGDKELRKCFCDRLGRPVQKFESAEAEGKHAKKVEGVDGHKTEGKTDVVIRWKDGTRTNVSVKMRKAGQVYLVTAANFAAAYRGQYGSKIPPRVLKALKLFVGEDAESARILERTPISVDGERVRVKIERKQNSRLVFDVIRNYDPAMAQGLLDWLREHIVEVFELCFAAGAVKDRKNWADTLWYKNLLDEGGDGVDYMVPLKRIKSALRRKAASLVVERGPRNGGSTIQLPFGHVQYHNGQLEFYQLRKKIRALLES